MSHSMGLEPEILGVGGQVGRVIKAWEAVLSRAGHRGAGPSVRARKARLSVGVFQSSPWPWPGGWREGQLEAGRPVWIQTRRPEGR